jgi:hypothetical protein
MAGRPRRIAWIRHHYVVALTSVMPPRLMMNYEGALRRDRQATMSVVVSDRPVVCLSFTLRALSTVSPARPVTRRIHAR